MSAGSAVVRYVNENAGTTFTAESREKITAPFAVELQDGRQLRNDREQLRRSGFILAPFRSDSIAKLELIENPSYYREGGAQESPTSERVREAYFSECAAFVKKLSGADHIFVISHAVRNGSGSKSSKGVEYLTAYATFAHCDYTVKILDEGWKMMVKRGVSEAEARSMRYCYYNLWAGTTHPVETAPLALLDWQSIDPADIRSVTLGYNITPKKDKDGRSKPAAPPIAQLVHNEAHRWYIFPNMQPDEAIIFTQVDQRPGFAQHSFHTAVKHQIKDDPIPRQSVEVRFICGFLPTNKEYGGDGARL